MRASFSLWRLFFVLLRYLFPRDAGRREDGGGRGTFLGTEGRPFTATDDVRTEREVDGDKMLALHDTRKYRNSETLNMGFLPNLIQGIMGKEPPKTLHVEES